MDLANRYPQPDEINKQESAAHYGEWTPACSTFNPNPVYMMQESHNNRTDDDIENENQLNDLNEQTKEFPPPAYTIEQTQKSRNGEEETDVNVTTPMIKRPEDTVDRAKLPLPPRPPEEQIMPASLPMTGTSLNQDKGIQEIVLEKDDRGKLGLKAKSIKMGIYVVEVVAQSPAFKNGILPGDRILQINGVKVDKFDDEKIHGYFRKLPSTPIRMLVNKRPLEKNFTIIKDEKGQLGLNLRGPKIHAVTRGSPADVVGLSTDYYILEVNGNKVKGRSDDEIRALLKHGTSVTVTVMPYYLYEPLMKQLPIR